MYGAGEVVIPNYFELDELPFLRQDDLILQQNLTFKRMHSIRNITHKYPVFLAKIFVYWPNFPFSPSSNKQQIPQFKISVFNELPIMPLQNFTYMVLQMQSKKQISKEQWNGLMTMIQNFKDKAPKIVDNFMILDYQIKQSNKKNVWFNIYYCVADNCFRMKISFKSLSFEISSGFEKMGVFSDAEDGYVIKCEAIVERLRQKMQEKLCNYYKRNFEQDKIAKIKSKFQQFYERDIKKVDESLLQLKLKYNYPVLRQKMYSPVYFVDSLDGSTLIQPIVSNKNKHCMYGHFNGYNSSNFTKLQGTSCQYCGIEIKQMQQNKLLMFLRDNMYNPSHCPLLYCPEFNRFKIMRKYSEVELARQKIEQLKISEENIQPKQQNAEEEMEMEDEYEKVVNEIKTEIVYYNYMHFYLNIKSSYPLTKARLKLLPTKELQYISFVYNLSNKKNKQEGYKYFKSFQLTNPARGKNCAHLEFADLRLFYISKKKVTTFSVHQFMYTCPICQKEMKDSQIIYLKEAVVLLKYIDKLLEVPEEDEFEINENKDHKVDRNSIRIIINNVQKKVFVQYVEESRTGITKKLAQIEKLYATLVDPYIPFSEYSLGLRKKSRRLQALYNIGNEQPETESDKMEKEWFGVEKNQFTI